MTELTIQGSLRNITVIHSRLRTPIPFRWTGPRTIEVDDSFADVASVQSGGMGTSPAMDALGIKPDWD